MRQKAATMIEFYGGYQVYSESGVDLTLLQHNLKLTVTQRWEQHARALKMMEAFQEAGRARSRTTATPAQKASG